MTRNTRIQRFRRLPWGKGVPDQAQGFLHLFCFEQLSQKIQKSYKSRGQNFVQQRAHKTTPCQSSQNPRINWKRPLRTSIPTHDWSPRCQLHQSTESHIQLFLQHLPLLCLFWEKIAWNCQSFEAVSPEGGSGRCRIRCLQHQHWLFWALRTFAVTDSQGFPRC